MRIASYTRNELMKEYPSLAHAMDELIESDPKKFYRLHVEYSGKFVHSKTKSVRRVSLGTVIDTLRDNGYEITITATKK